MLRKTRRNDVRRTPAATDPLVAALASSDPEVAERAKADLVARGADAVPLLIACLDADADGLRLRALSLLSLLGDPRAAASVASLLRHADPAIRSRAAGALARLAAPGVIPALSRLLSREKDAGVRLAATRSLVRLLRTGHDEAFRPLFDLIADPEEVAKIRAAAIEAVPWATPQGDGAPLAALLGRLADDPDKTVAAKAKRLLTAPPRPRLDQWALDKLVVDLRSGHLPTWRRAVSRLGRAGGAVVEPLLHALAAAPADRELARRTVLVLKALSSRQLTRLGPFIDETQEPVPLEALVEVADAAGSRALQARLAALVKRLAEGAEGSGPGPLHGVRQLAHRALARHGSRLGAEDLRRLLEDRRYPLGAPLVEAAALIGARRELRSVIRGYQRSRGVTRLALRDALQAICRREKIRRTDRVFAQLSPEEFAAAKEILGAPRTAAKRRRIPRFDRAANPLLT